MARPRRRSGVTASRDPTLESLVGFGAVYEAEARVNWMRALRAASKDSDSPTKRATGSRT